MNIFRAIRFPDFFSLLNALFGFGAILSVSSGNGDLSVLLVILSAVADGIDGFLARKMKPGELGPGLDSLADLISFGVAPAALAVAASDHSILVLATSLIYLTCGTLRLARFNVSVKDDKFFEGFPITASGVTVAASVLLDRPMLTTILMLVLAALMVSSIPYLKIRDAKILIAFALILLVCASLVRFLGDANFSGTLIMTAMAVYTISPLVMLCLQKES